MGGRFDRCFAHRGVQAMACATLLALRAAVVNVRQTPGFGVTWAPPGTNATLATNPYLGPWAPQVPGMMGPWGAAASQQIIVSVDAMPLIMQQHSRRHPDMPRSHWNHPLNQRGDLCCDRAWTALRDVIIKLKRAGYDGVVVCFDSNKKKIYYDARKDQWNFRAALRRDAKKHSGDVQAYIDHCKARLDHFNIAWAEDEEMNGETLAASLVSRGHFQGHIVASAYSSDIDILFFTPHFTKGVHRKTSPYRRPEFIIGYRSAIWQDMGVPHLPHEFHHARDIVSTYAAFGCLNEDFARGRWSRLRGAGVGDCMWKRLWDWGAPAHQFIRRSRMLQDWGMPALVEMRCYHPNARRGVEAHVFQDTPSTRRFTVPQVQGANGDTIIAKLEAHREARDAAAAAAAAGAPAVAPSTFQNIPAVGGRPLEDRRTVLTRYGDAVVPPEGDRIA